MKNDPTTGSKYYTEAAKLEEAAATRAKDNAMVSGASMSAAGMYGVDSDVDAVVLINPEGTIKFANRLACKLFGYRKGDLKGEKPSSLLPAAWVRSPTP